MIILDMKMLVLAVAIVGLISINEACLHNGCSMSGGLQSSDVETKKKTLIRDSEKEDHIITVVTWNLAGKKQDWNSKKSNVCEQLRVLKPTIFGLQGVDETQINDIDTCLNQEYLIFKKQMDNTDGLRNPIFIKRAGEKIKILSQGSFGLTKLPHNLESKMSGANQNRHCMWVKISFGIEEEVKRKRENFKDKLERLLGIFTGRHDHKSPVVTSTVIRKIYRYKTMFIANTQLNDSDVDIATAQVKELLWFLKSRVMDRRRHPVVVMGDFGYETNSKVHEEIRKHQWLENTMEYSRRTYPDTSYISDASTYQDKLRDFIFENKFNQLLSAVITDTKERGEHRPVITVLSK